MDQHLARQLTERFGRKDAETAVLPPTQALDRSLSPMRIKRAELGDNGRFSGYLSIFNNVDFYGEIVRPGAFTETIKNWKAEGSVMPLLWQHSSFEPIGVWNDLKEDDTGLWADGQILVDAGPLEQRAWAHVKAGSLSGLSIGYYVNKWSMDEEEGILYLDEIDLREGSLVTFPANREAQIDTVKKTSLELRRRVAHGEPLTVRQMEFALREHCGLSKAEARGVIDTGYKTWLSQSSDLGDDSDHGWNEPPRGLNI
ncbi:MAG: HK97 family phage prohead protease [Flavobacteriaceae bacterium]|jgi:hypothetical protein|nr:HK97 family phage prohead protease [Flavobacteriaceae bacterium]|tara:strand:- start:29909 stop:30676 length:768 start_codon:yes stop_codon:yes gene_type:complete